MSFVCIKCSLIKSKLYINIHPVHGTVINVKQFIFLNGFFRRVLLIFLFTLLFHNGLEFEYSFIYVFTNSYLAFISSEMQQVLENLTELPSSTGAEEIDLIFLKGIMENPIVKSLAKVY